MIEGIIVVSTMLVFMGLITYTRQGYGMKMDLQQATRANTFYYASHGCEGDTSGAESEGSGPAPGNGTAENAANKSSVPNKAAASRSYNTASATSNGSTSFQYVFDANANGGNQSINYQKKQGKRTITAASKVTCNEKKYDNQWTAWFQFGVDFVSRGFGGVGDLFKQ